MSNKFIRKVNAFVENGFYCDDNLPLSSKQDDLNQIFLTITGYSSINEEFLEELLSKFVNIFVSETKIQRYTKLYTMNSCFSIKEHQILSKLFTTIDTNLDCASEDYSFARSYNNSAVRLFIVVFVIISKYKNLIYTDPELEQMFIRLDDTIDELNKL